MSILIERLGGLAKKLSLTNANSDCPAALRQRLSEVGRDAESHEPWRCYVEALRDNLENFTRTELKTALDEAPAVWLETAEGPPDSETLRRPLIRLVDTFGLHLAHIELTASKQRFLRKGAKPDDGRCRNRKWRKILRRGVKLKSSLFSIKSSPLLAR